MARSRVASQRARDAAVKKGSNDLKEYDGAWHVRINDQWRLTFKWGASGPFDVLIEDPH
jgi:proteic killer suppression protein